MSVEPRGSALGRAARNRMPCSRAVRRRAPGDDHLRGARRAQRGARSSAARAAASAWPRSTAVFVIAAAIHARDRPAQRSPRNGSVGADARREFAVLVVRRARARGAGPARRVGGVAHESEPQPSGATGRSSCIAFPALRSRSSCRPTSAVLGTALQGDGSGSTACLRWTEQPLVKAAEWGLVSACSPRTSPARLRLLALEVPCRGATGRRRSPPLAAGVCCRSAFAR